MFGIIIIHEQYDEEFEEYILDTLKKPENVKNEASVKHFHLNNS